MPTLGNQQRRRRAIAELLQSHVIRRQSELVRLLRAEGLESTQSSISRDLRDLGVAKLTTGYSLPEPGRGNNADALGPVAEFFRDIRPAGPNLLVIATAVGALDGVTGVEVRRSAKAWDTSRLNDPARAAMARAFTLSVALPRKPTACPRRGAAARKFRYEVPVGNVGVNIGVAAPMAYFPFSGWKDSFLGVLHGQGRDAVEFYTEKKVVIERWPKEWSRRF